MAKTYTFPNQVLPSGTLAIEIITSTGSGTESPTEKYFASELITVDETEFFGGDIQSPYVDLVIENDVDNLFSGTILPVALTDGGWVQVKITLDSKIRFLGAIIPSTISKIPFYATNDSLENAKMSIKFRCKWLLSLLEDITAESLYNQILSSPANYTSMAGTSQQYPGSDMQFTWCSVRSIVDSIFTLFNSTYGFTYSLGWETDPMVFYSKDVTDSSAYVFPDETLEVGRIDSASLSQPLNCPGIILSIRGDSANYFDEDSPIYFGNCYNAFVQVLESFGLVLSFSYSTDVDFIIKIGVRVSGSEFGLTDTISHEETPFNELARSGANVTSLASGNEFDERFNSLGLTKYTGDVLFDFHNDNDFPGGHVLNTSRSLCIPYGSRHVQLIREIGIGDNLLSNASFDSDLTGWSVESGTWAWSATDIGYGAGCARVTLNTTDPQELKQTLSASLNDNAIFSFRVGGYLTANTVIKFKFYSGARYFTITRTIPGSLLSVTIPVPVYGVRRMSGQARFSPIDAVSVIVESAANYGSEYLYFDFGHLYRDRQGTPELVGCQVRDYFSSNLLTRKVVKINGIPSEVNTGDFFQIDGTRYYVKKIQRDLIANETEIEAINYPY